MLRQNRRASGFIAMNDENRVGMARKRQGRAGNDYFGAMIATHRVERDPDLT